MRKPISHIKCMFCSLEVWRMCNVRRNHELEQELQVIGQTRLHVSLTLFWIKFTLRREISHYINDIPEMCWIHFRFLYLKSSSHNFVLLTEVLIEWLVHFQIGLHWKALALLALIFNICELLNRQQCEFCSLICVLHDFPLRQIHVCLYILKSGNHRGLESVSVRKCWIWHILCQM